MSQVSRRIVLFGMPDAGKSSLLGALAQAAQTQEHILKVRLIDKAQGLVELQRRLYEERPRETLEEVVPYSIVLEPLPNKNQATPAEASSAILVDCDGRVANEILARSGALDGTTSEGALARAIRDADTLLLVVDASSNPAELKRDFAQFTRFLHLLETSRGRRSEVGGLPVYLVLSKCDLLATKDDTTHSWMDRIEERKRDVHQRFKEFLAEQAANEPLAFGKIDLHVWATAVKRPALADSPARPKEPYGVAELFRQCFASAEQFQERRVLANRRLTWTVGVSAGVLAVMVLFALILIVSQPDAEATALADEVRQFRSTHPPDRPAERLRGPLEEKLRKLQKIEESSHFARLDPDLKDYVSKSRLELMAFQSVAERLKEVSDSFNSDLNKVKNEEQLQTIKMGLEKIQVPELFKGHWTDVKDIRRRQKWLEQIGVIEREAEKLRVSYRKLVDDAKKVRDMLPKNPLFEVQERAKGVVDRARRLPAPADSLPGAEEVTYEVVYRLESVAAVHSQWEPLRTKLLEVINLLKTP